METNIIKAIINFTQAPIVKLKEVYNNKNRANSMGDALEEYVKDLFASTFSYEDEKERLKEFNKYFSYLGNTTNPPDIIIKNGDAIEVKKIENFTSDLALNSSYPKNKLYSNSPMITKSCRQCETWTEKDIIYIVGSVQKQTNKLRHISMIYGIDYAADIEIYTRIKKAISSGIRNISNLEFSETKELGRVNRVDPLGITNLRIRGMWTIKNPLKVFDYIYKREANKEINMMVIINEEKYKKLKYINDLEDLANRISELNIEDVMIKDPNNPSNLKKAKLITYSK